MSFADESSSESGGPTAGGDALPDLRSARSSGDMFSKLHACRDTITNNIPEASSEVAAAEKVLSPLVLEKLRAKQASMATTPRNQATPTTPHTGGRASNATTAGGRPSTGEVPWEREVAEDASPPKKRRSEDPSSAVRRAASSQRGMGVTPLKELSIDDSSQSSQSGDSPRNAAPPAPIDSAEGFDAGDFFKFNAVPSSAAAATAALPPELQHLPPWCIKRFQDNPRGYHSNALLALHQEITDLFDYLRPTSAEVFMRRKVEMELSDIAKGYWPECDPCVYGSMSTQLVLPMSDIDMSVLNVTTTSVDDALSAIAKDLSRQQLCLSAFPRLILQTKVPLVKFTHRHTWVDVDVSINAGDGKTNTAAVRKLMDMYPESKCLTILVKYFLQQRDMAEPYRGGLGSFATTLLVISFLQQHPIYTSHVSERGKCGLGKLLVDFFRYYGECFNYHRLGISLRNGGYYFPKSDHGDGHFGPRGPPQLVIEDPSNPSNNVASSVRTFHTVTQAFSHAYAALTGTWATNPKVANADDQYVANRPTLLSRIIHADPAMILRRDKMAECYNNFLASATPDEVEKLKNFKMDEDEGLFRLIPHPLTPLARKSQRQQEKPKAEAPRSSKRSSGYSPRSSDGGYGHHHSSRSERRSGGGDSGGRTRDRRRERER